LYTLKCFTSFACIRSVFTPWAWGWTFLLGDKVSHWCRTRLDLRDRLKCSSEKVGKLW
jgi:hypothetical protein